MERRTFLGAASAALGGTLAAAAAWLGSRFVAGSARWPVRNAARWVALCRLADLAPGEPLAASFTFERLEGWHRERVTRHVYVIRDADGLPRVLSRTCTHLGCPVRWRAPERRFGCACHGGSFHADGRVAGGPPPRPLPAFAARIAGELVEVQAS